MAPLAREAYTPNSGQPTSTRDRALRVRHPTEERPLPFEPTTRRRADGKATAAVHNPRRLAPREAGDEGDFCLRTRARRPIRRSAPAPAAAGHARAFRVRVALQHVRRDDVRGTARHLSVRASGSSLPTEIPCEEPNPALQGRSKYLRL